MRFTRIRPSVAFLAATVPALLIAAQNVNAQDVDLSGTWIFEVQTDEGASTATVTLVQDGASLTGQYRSEAFGEADIAGIVEGSAFSFSFDTAMPGAPSTVTYDGRVESRFRAANEVLLALEPLQPVRARGPGAPEPIILIDGVPVPMRRTDELSGTVDLGGFASGMFSARREESRR